MRAITIAAAALALLWCLPALAQFEDEESDVLIEEEVIPPTPDKLLRGIKHYKNKEYGLAALDLWEVVTDDYYEYYHDSVGECIQSEYMEAVELYEAHRTRIRMVPVH